MYYELDRNFVQFSGSCGPQSARAQFIVDAQTVTRIQDSGGNSREDVYVETREVDWCDQKHSVRVYY